jgi:parvulin-like peptidyl-prolyl isomerase
MVAGAALALALGAAGDALAGEDALAVNDAVVAVVNRQVVTQKDLFDRARGALARLDRNLSAAEGRAAARRILSDTLRTIVDEKLMVAEADRLLAANESFQKQFEEHVKAAIEEDRRKQGGEVPFREALRKQGLTYAQFEEQLRDTIKQVFILDEFVRRDLTVGPGEVLHYYKENPAEFTEPVRVKCRQIFIAVDATRTREEARKLADDAMALLKKEYDFATLAAKRSDLRAQEGGLYDFVPQGTFVKPVDELVFSLPAGEIGGPVEWDKGFTIVKVEERKPGRMKPFEEVQDAIEVKLVQQKRIQRYNALIRRLEEQNYVEIEQVTVEAAVR